MPRVLVVDDSALIRRSVTEQLVRAGHEVVAVASGEEAVEKTLREPFDLVVSDVRMGAMTGVQLCRVIRSDPATRDLPVVLLTASDDPRSRFWGLHAGADAYLAKEGTFEALLPTIERLLAERPPHSRELPKRTHVDAASRVSAVMDRHLFEAVLASEARKLMMHIEERDVLLRAAAGLLRDVLGTAYLTLTLGGKVGPTHAIVARGPFPVAPSDREFTALGLEPSDSPPLLVRERDPRWGDGVALEAGELETYPLEVAGEVLGALRIHGGKKRIGSEDRTTAALLATAIAPVVKSLVLVEETRRLALTDALTGLANRRTLVARLEHEDHRAARYENPFSVVMLDVDHFKWINDRFGHSMGDGVLRAIADVVRASVRNVDMAGRWGGEEFLLLLPECDHEGALVVAERVRTSVEAMRFPPHGPERVTVSCGVATRILDEPSGMSLVDRADAALYEAKRNGRNRVVAGGPVAAPSR